MSRRIEFTANYSLPAEIVHRTLVDGRFWNQRAENGADKGLTLDHLTTGEGTIDVGLAQAIDTSQLPSLVTKVIKGDVSIVRSEAWGPLVDGKAEGTFSAVATGIPINATGTASLVDTPEGSTLRIEGDVDVNVKLIGGAIEGMVADQILGILGRDQEVVEEWVAANA
ncbi:DUF2505 domain-containing protein [Rhodococcus maanshanensis]|uniref:DUF2505 domain-containing protein n=1 Tax=Rhodococcus maanshanensis TaxID=183556 RepID=A0A1H7J3K6_9NOCA|nr:DUF2505 domain-containing protein [Rhodococcus maanshanensis]SEK69258.1 Protein of unknown function [Rhodococcus maanshanensis]